MYLYFENLCMYSVKYCMCNKGRFFVLYMHKKDLEVILNCQPRFGAIMDDIYHQFKFLWMNGQKI